MYIVSVIAAADRLVMLIPVAKLSFCKRVRIVVCRESTNMPPNATFFLQQEVRQALLQHQQDAVDDQHPQHPLDVQQHDPVAAEAIEPSPTVEVTSVSSALDDEDNDVN